MALRRKKPAMAKQIFRKRSSTTEPPMVEVKALKKSYTDSAVPVQALRGVSLKVPRGEMLAIMGQSGSGKSTLLNMIGLLDQPDAGTVLLAGEDVSELRRRKIPMLRQREVGIIFQNKNLIPTLTALENVYLPFRYTRGKKSLKLDQAKEALRLVGLVDRADHKPSQLSGGEQQRVAIARALVLNPAIVLADEPTGELDTKTGRAVMDLLVELNRTTNQTFVIITHNPEVAARCSRTIYMSDGQILPAGRGKK